MAIGFGLLLGVCQLWFGMLALTMVTKRLDQTKAEQAETWETVTDYSSLGLNYGAVDAEVDRGGGSLSSSSDGFAFASSTSPTIIDILSVGSNSRPNFLQAQRETMGTHHTVRFFVGVTEHDDTETCHDLDVADVRAIARFCKIPKMNIVPGEPQSVLQYRRRGYADWTTFLSKKENPSGWLCAQKRANSGFHRLMTTQYQNGSFPDYLMVVDDDTFVDLTEVTAHLQTFYPPQIPMVMAGCLIRFIGDNMTLPWGGWGTILSRGALENLARPINCTTSNLHDVFLINACQRLRQNLFNEQLYYHDGITIANWMNAYVTSQRFVDYKQWTATSNFCAHSDWIWGYFFNYYNIGQHTGDPTYHALSEHRIHSYQVSEFFAGRKMDPKTRQAMEGQCRYQRDKCIAGSSHICHYVSSEAMYNLTRSLKEIRGPAEYLTSGWVPYSDWESLWTRRHDNRANQPRKSCLERRRSRSPRKPTPVFVWPFMNHTIEHELKHFVWDGVQNSRAMELSYNASVAPLWIVDVKRAGLSLMKYCSRFTRIVRDSIAAKQALGILDEWDVVFLHWDDSPKERFLDCFRVVRIIGNARVHRYKRSVVDGRIWNETNQFVDPGHMVNYGNWRDHSGSPVAPINYGVRSDVVHGLYSIAKERRRRADLGRIDDVELVQSLPRTTDVSHFWPVPGRGEGKITRGLASRLRDAVSMTIDSKFDKAVYSIFVDVTGKAEDKGRNEAQYEYLSKLLDSKIVVVAQKDRWEDHYRLMEALVSGAMVMSDPMLNLPSGLRDQESIVVYQSLDDLVTQVTYYLNNTEARQAIALAGYRAAMRQHRSWHMMQRILVNTYALHHKENFTVSS